MFVTNEGGKALTSGREKSFFLSFSHQYDDSVKTTQRWPVVIDAMVTIRPAAIMMKEFERFTKDINEHEMFDQANSQRRRLTAITIA